MGVPGLSKTFPNLSLAVTVGSSSTCELKPRLLVPKYSYVRLIWHYCPKSRFKC